MRLSAPSYYSGFSCIADKCRHSCCIGWEIDIDREAEKRYKRLSGDIGSWIEKSIDRTGTPHFKLSRDMRCPHLDGRGLCTIITELGEEYLCDICRRHPRFYNATPYGVEVGLGMACEAAAELILSSEEYRSMEGIDEEAPEYAPSNFDGVKMREKIFHLLADSRIPYAERLLRIYREYGVTPSSISDGEWHSLISSLEYMEDGSRVKFLCYSSGVNPPIECESMLERALAYLVFRHVTAADGEEDARMALGACLFLERLLASLASSFEVCTLRDMAELARTLSSELEYSEDNMEEIKMMFF